MTRDTVSMGLLFRIVGAAAREVEDAAKIVKGLARFGEEVRISTQQLPSLIKIEKGVSKVGNIPLSTIEKNLKLGNVVDSAKVLYGIEHVPDTLRIRLDGEVKTLPSYHVGRVERGAEDMKNLFKDLPDSKNLSDANFAGKLTEDMVKKSSRLQELVKFIGSKRFWSLTAGAVGITGGATYVISLINTHRLKLSGCFRYSVVNGKPLACKIAACSCNDGAIIVTDGVSMCGSSDMIPASMNIASACAETTGTVCVNCPSEQVLNEGKGSLDNPASLETHSQSDKVFYKCVNASIFDAIADLVGDQVDEVNRAVGAVTETVSDFLSLVFKILKWLGVFFAILIGLGGSAWAVVKYRQINRGSYDLLPQESHESQEL